MQKKHQILITGSSGMLGIDLSQELGGGCEVVGADIVHSPQSIVHSFKECDITDEKVVLDVVTEVRPDIVIHTAAMTDVDECETNKDKAYKINSEGTWNVALGCKKINASLIYISTDFVFDGKKKEPYKESDKVSPLSVYGDSKLKGEEAVKKAIKRYFIVRTSWLYGGHGKNFVDTILLKAKAGQTLKVVDDQSGSPTYTKDLAKALHALLDKMFTGSGLEIADYGTYHVSNSGSVSWCDYAKEIISSAGLKVKVEPISSKELDAPANRPAMSVLDNSKFAGFTGYRMKGWKDALREYLITKVT